MDYGTRYMCRQWARANEHRRTPEYAELVRRMELAASRAESDVEAAFPEGPNSDNAKEYARCVKDRVSFWKKQIGV